MNTITNSLVTYIYAIRSNKKTGVDTPVKSILDDSIRINQALMPVILIAVRGWRWAVRLR